MSANRRPCAPIQPAERKAEKAAVEPYLSPTRAHLRILDPMKLRIAKKVLAPWKKAGGVGGIHFRHRVGTFEQARRRLRRYVIHTPDWSFWVRLFEMRP